MSQVDKHIALMGHKVECKATGFKGVVTSLSFDLYGCIQALVHPGVGADGKLLDQCWLDVNRLKVLSTERVMDLPDFSVGAIADAGKGPAEKPVSSY